VADLVRELNEFGCDVTVHDPVAKPAEAMHEYGIELTAWENIPLQADALVVAVSHQEYLDMPIENLLDKIKNGGVFVDVKSAFEPSLIQGAGYQLWRL
jgi:UDP-N-acetyl-D-galactosamine dehydrogenase